MENEIQQKQSPAATHGWDTVRKMGVMVSCRFLAKLGMVDELRTESFASCPRWCPQPGTLVQFLIELLFLLLIRHRSSGGGSGSSK